MKDLLGGIRRPTARSRSSKFLYSTILFIAGVILGIVSKLLDETPSNILPHVLDMMDLRNFFSRMGVWIFLAVLISVYSNSPRRAAIHVCLFFVGMVGSYYLYTVMIAGFFPRSYMMIWIVMTAISPFLAFVCWYAKGQGMIAITISSLIIMVISRQTFAFGFWYFDVLYPLELLLWIATIVILYQSPRQISIVTSIGLVLYFLTAQIDSLWGML